MDYTDFGWALDKLRAGYQVARKGWNGRHRLALQVPDAHSKMSAPYIYITTEKGVVIPWLASQEDMLAEDWEVVAVGPQP